MIASALQLGVAPLVERIEHDEHRAEVRAVGRQQDRLPGHGHVWRARRASPGRACRLCAITSCVRSHRRRVGQLHVDQQLALSCCGMKPVGIRVKSQYVRPSRPP